MRPDFNPATTTHYLPKLDYDRARRHGWTLASRDDGTWAIEKFADDPLDTFQDDRAAYEFVLGEAVEGSPDHREAFVLDGKKITSLPRDFDLAAVAHRLFGALTPLTATLH